jgi:sarcosine oxidase, subunit gamma
MVETATQDQKVAMTSSTASKALAIDGRACTLTEALYPTTLNIRGDALNASFVGAIASVLGLALPAAANTGSFGEGKQLLWLGPDEWLYKSTRNEAQAIGEALRIALAGQHVAIVDVSSGYHTLVVSGAATVDLIARGCPLDLHPQVFGTHAVAQSHIAKSAVLLVALEAGLAFEITVRRSFARYLGDWLTAAADF